MMRTGLKVLIIVKVGEREIPTFLDSLASLEQTINDEKAITLFCFAMVCNNLMSAKLRRVLPCTSPLLVRARKWSMFCSL